MKLKETDFNLININFEFRNQIVRIKAEPYKIFQEVKYLALNKFIDIFNIIPNNLHFYFLGKDLIDKEQEKIGNIFNNKEQITILLRLPKLKLNSNLKTYKNNLSLNRKYITNKEGNSFESNIFLFKSNYNNRDKINKSYLNLRSNRINTLNKSSSMPSIPFLNSEKKPPSIKHHKHVINDKFNFDLNLNDLGNYAFCDKHKYKVSEYCRNCKKFICQECLFSELHKGHMTIQLNLSNLEESIRLYIMLLRTNEQKNAERIKDQDIEMIDFDALNKKGDEMMDKFDKIITNYHSFMRKIDKKIGNDKKKYRIMVINNFNDVAMRISMQINSILNKFDLAIKKKGTNFTFDDLQYYLDEISKKEETLELIRERTVKYLLTFEINNKFETTFDKIESTLDAINNEENPFDLDAKYNKELFKILDSGNNNINKEKNNKKQITGILKNNYQRRNGLIPSNL